MKYKYSVFGNLKIAQNIFVVVIIIYFVYLSYLFLIFLLFLAILTNVSLSKYNIYIWKIIIFCHKFFSRFQFSHTGFHDDTSQKWNILLLILWELFFLLFSYFLTFENSIFLLNRTNKKQEETKSQFSLCTL